MSELLTVQRGAELQWPQIGTLAPSKGAPASLRAEL